MERSNSAPESFRSTLRDTKMKLLVSACLLGCPCRYDGKSKPCDAVIALGDSHILIPFCPEIYGGLSTPRIPAEIRDGRVITKDGREVTEAYEKGAEAALALYDALGCDGAILKAKSPSCGVGRVYDGSFTGTLVSGYGVTAARFRSRGIPLCTEEWLFPILANTMGKERACCRDSIDEKDEKKEECVRTYSFTKMHGCGNDYICIDQFRPPYVHDPSALARQMADRHTAVGSDGLILICPPENPANHARMRMYNADGSEGKMCGNGIRCVGKFLVDHGYVRVPEIRVETGAGLRIVRPLLDDDVCIGASVNMGRAVFPVEEMAEQAQNSTGSGAGIGARIPFWFHGTQFAMTAVSMGNPHAVCFLGQSPDDLPLADFATAVTALTAEKGIFPDGVNVEAARILGKDRIEMRVYERGSGETMACGTGACAVVCAAILEGVCAMEQPITVMLRGGEVTVTVHRDFTVTLTGPAAISFTGVYRLG